MNCKKGARRKGGGRGEQDSEPVSGKPCEKSQKQTQHRAAQVPVPRGNFTAPGEGGAHGNKKKRGGKEERKRRKDKQNKGKKPEKEVKDSSSSPHKIASLFRAWDSNRSKKWMRGRLGPEKAVRGQTMQEEKKISEKKLQRSQKWKGDPRKPCPKRLELRLHFNLKGVVQGGEGPKKGKP